MLFRQDDRNMAEKVNFIFFFNGVVLISRIFFQNLNMWCLFRISHKKYLFQRI